MKNLLITVMAVTLLGHPSKLHSQSPQPAPGAQWKEFEGVRIPVPPPEHPRLYLHAANLADLRGRIFQRDGGAIADSSAVTIPGSGDRKIFIAGLVPGTWRLATQTEAKEGSVSPEAGSLFFTGKAGAWRFERIASANHP